MKWLCVESSRPGNIITEIRLPAGSAPATFVGRRVLKGWGVSSQVSGLGGEQLVNSSQLTTIQKCQPRLSVDFSYGRGINLDKFNQFV